MGSKTGVLRLAGNHPVELSEIPKWDPVVPEWETPGWATDSMDTTDWEPPVPGNWDPPGFWGLETGRWAIPPTPGMRWGTDGEQRKNKERINDKTMIQSWQIIQMQVDTQDQADKLMRIGEIG